MSTRPLGRRHVTFGDDGSAGADLAWSWLTSQVWTGWSVDCLHAAVTRNPESARSETGSAIRHAPARCGFTSVRSVSTPLEARIALPAHEQTDLIVIGAHNAGAARWKALGSTAQSLVTGTEIPVVVAHDSAPVRTVLACVDGSLSSDIAVETMTGLPYMARAAVTVVRVRTSAHERDAQAGIAQDMADRLSRQGLRASARTVDPVPHATLTSPAFRILEMAERIRPDLIVLGRTDRSVVSRVSQGSTALEVTSKSRCPVLLAGPVRTAH